MKVEDSTKLSLKRRNIVSCQSLNPQKVKDLNLRKILNDSNNFILRFFHSTFKIFFRIINKNKKTIIFFFINYLSEFF